jgi:6-pyruvoyltetrahydropterin/6-carboxytetrahydropterin synthase
MYKVGRSKSFRAWHVMPGAEGPEGELHTHDYRIDVVVGREQLDDRGMVIDLDVLEAAMTRVVSSVEDQNLEIIQPPDAQAVTVEVLARWAHGRITEEIGSGVERLTVKAWETPEAYGGYSTTKDP